MAQQVWLTNTLGGYLTNNRLSKTIREQAQPLYVYRQFCDVKEGGAHKGDIVYFDKFMAMDTLGGTLVETNTISPNLVKINKGSVQVTEYGNAIAYTDKLDTLAEFDVKNQYSRWLVNDHKMVTDSACANQFGSAEFVAVCTNTATTVFTTNGSATITATANMSDKNVMDIVDYMKKAWIPGVGGGTGYNCIASVNSLRGLYTFLQAIMQYTTPEFAFKDEVGRFYGCRFVEDRFYLSDTKNSSYGEAIFFGDEAVMEAVAQPEEVRYQERDFGRDKQLAWYGILGWTKMWSLSSDGALCRTNKGTERILKVTSA